MLDGDQPQPSHDQWFDIVINDTKIGDMTNGTWSFKLKRNIGFGLVAVNCNDDQLVVAIAGAGNDALAELYRRHAPWLLARLRRRRRHRA